VYAPRLGDPPHIVSDHIDDHDIFRPVLFRMVEPFGLFAVFVLHHPPRGGPLHGSRGQSVIIELKKELRGG
jgi:hypothetical protein